MLTLLCGSLAINVAVSDSERTVLLNLAAHRAEGTSYAAQLRALCTHDLSD